MPMPALNSMANQVNSENSGRSSSAPRRMLAKRLSSNHTAKSTKQATDVTYNQPNIVETQSRIAGSTVATCPVARTPKPANKTSRPTALKKTGGLMASLGDSVDMILAGRLNGRHWLDPNKSAQPKANRGSAYPLEAVAPGSKFPSSVQSRSVICPRQTSVWRAVTNPSTGRRAREGCPLHQE